MKNRRLLILTNQPAFYKIKLYNEINKKRQIHVLFTGKKDRVKGNLIERKSDFFDEKDGDFYLIVFQRLHFGPVTVLNSEGCFVKENKWAFKPEKADFEKELTLSYIWHIKNKTDENNTQQNTHRR